MGSAAFFDPLARTELKDSGRPPVALPSFRAWTDDFSNLLRLLK